ncbi:MAG TPA: DinB family protein [Thermoanaerobaculia bacterium]|nr:DinB family protein [Thermoanaerobaculia bacterium]
MNTLLEEVIEAWEGTRDGIIAEVENVPPKQFDFRPAPESRSVSELVRHIMEVSLMMVGELTREDTNFTRAPWPKLLAMYSKPIEGVHAKRELLTALRSTTREGVKAFRDAGELHMLQLIRRFDGKLGTRLAWFNHGVAHENYHQGQLASYQRLIGIKPALTKLIEGG